MNLLPLALVLSLAPAESLEKRIDRAVESAETPGISVLIRKNGRTIFERHRGFSNLETRTKMSRDSVHEMASVSKQFTAAGIMKLVESGKLSLDDPLSKFVESPPEAWKSVTMRHLLQHTSGLPDYLDPEISMTQNTTAKALLYSLIDRPMQFKPGEKWAYSNSGYMALGYIVATASGQTFEKFMLDQIFVPAGMKTAHVADPARVVENRAYGYQKSEKAWVNEMYVSRGLSALGDGMVMASPLDLVAWHESMMANRVLSASSWSQMFTPSSLQKYGFGLGIERAGSKPRVSHSGGWVGTNTFFLSDLESDSCVIVLCNTDLSPLREVVALAKARLDKVP